MLRGGEQLKNKQDYSVKKEKKKKTIITTQQWRIFCGGGQVHSPISHTTVQCCDVHCTVQMAELMEYVVVPV